MIQMLHPVSLTPEELDEYLDRGWYRMGQGVFTCGYVMFGGELYSVSWIRLALENYRFRKSLRRSIRNIEQRFRIELRPTVLSMEKERLYQRYRENFPGELAEFLGGVLYDREHTGRDIFNTWEIAIFDGDKLIAFSFFDRGQESIQSVIGVYDPDYARHSLGFASMLLEIRFGIENGLKYFYPGYVVPGYPSFDYKLRVGDVEFYEPEEEIWLPWKQLKPEQLPSRQIYRTLQTIQTQLNALQISSKMCLYPLYKSAFLDERLRLCVHSPLILDCTPDSNNSTRILVTFDPASGQIALEQVYQIADLTDRFPNAVDRFQGTTTTYALFTRILQLAKSHDPAVIVAALQKHPQHIMRNLHRPAAAKPQR